MKLKRGKKSGLVYFSYSDIKQCGPCYDPIKYIPKTWRGTAVDILKMDNISFNDRLWCVCRNGITSDRVMRLFAVWCARQVQHLIKDKRSLDALDVAERFANGLATAYELYVARYAASDAASDAAWYAAWYAAWAAQRDKLIEMLLEEGKEYVEKKRGSK